MEQVCLELSHEMDRIANFHGPIYALSNENVCQMNKHGWKAEVLSSCM